jgi:FlaG/FlaF family flagellin (archaellin)
MVAITVILAAVIGGFVLNLGGNLQSTPQAQIGVEADNSGSGGIDIVHNGGDPIPDSDMQVTIDAPSNSISNANFESEFNGYSGSDFSVGDTVDFNEGTGEYTVTIIHEPSDSILVETTITV